MVKLKPWFLNFSPKGRSPLSHAWLNLLSWSAIILGYMILGMILNKVSNQALTYNGVAASIFSLLFFVITIFGCIDTVMMQIRRLHDVNLPAILWLLYLVPVVSLLNVYWFYLKPGKKEANPYGPPFVDPSVE